MNNVSKLTKFLICVVIVIAVALLLTYEYFLSYQIERGTKMADQGLKLVYEGKYTEAEVLLNKALNAIPSYKKESLSLVYKDLAFSFELQGKIDKAIDLSFSSPKPELSARAVELKSPYFRITS